MCTSFKFNLTNTLLHFNLLENACNLTLFIFNVIVLNWPLVELEIQYFPLELHCYTPQIYSFLVSRCKLILPKKCTPERTQQPEETRPNYIYKISPRVKIHATHVLCSLPFWIYFGSCPEGQISSRTTVCFQSKLTLNFLRIAPTTYSQPKHTAHTHTHTHTHKGILLSHN